MPIPAVTLVLYAMDFAIAALKAGPEAKRAYDDWRRELEEMRREGRDLTPADLERFDRRIRANRDVLFADDPPEPAGEPRRRDDREDDGA